MQQSERNKTTSSKVTTTQGCRKCVFGSLAVWGNRGNDAFFLPDKSTNNPNSAFFFHNPNSWSMSEGGEDTCSEASRSKGQLAADRATEVTCGSLTTAKVGFSAKWSQIYSRAFQPSFELQEDGKKRHVYEHPAAQRALNQRRVGAGSECSQQRLRTLHPEDVHTYGVTAGGCRTSHAVKLREQTDCLLCCTFSFSSMHCATGSDTWWRRRVASQKINVILTTLSVSTHRITIDVPCLVHKESGRHSCWVCCDDGRFTPCLGTNSE